MKNLLVILIILISNKSYSVDNNYQRKEIRINGSSTLYPFITVASEKFKIDTGKLAPIVESTGTGGGISYFCSGKSLKYPDIVMASRKMKNSEVELCKSNGVSNIKEHVLGLDGILIVSNKDSLFNNLSLNDLYKAIAKYITVDNKVIENNKETWRDVNPSLPNIKIEFYGPSSASGTREAFSNLVLKKICMEDKIIIEKIQDEEYRSSICSQIRTDGKFIEIADNENLVIQKLSANINAVGIIGYNFLASNENIKALLVNSAIASSENIINGHYPLSRPLYFYVKEDNYNQILYLQDFVNELISKNASGRNGYLTKRGLIPKVTNN